MFVVGDMVTIKSGEMYDGCGCEYCGVLSSGGYGVIQSIRERPNSNEGATVKLHLFDEEGVKIYDHSYNYRLSGLELSHNNNRTPDWEV
jgi:hypothetical protein